MESASCPYGNALDACGPLAGGCIDRARQDREVGVAEPREHFLKDGASLFNACRALDARAILGADGIPIEASGSFLPVRVADGGPDFVEGGEMDGLGGQGRCHA